MKTSPRPAGAKRPTQDEMKGLERALDKTYARLRERARAAWERHQAGKKDAADERVSVRISATSKAPAAVLEIPNPTRRRLTKASKPRRKVPATKRARRK